MLELISLAAISTTMVLGVAYGVVIAQQDEDDAKLLRSLLVAIVLLIATEVGIVLYVETLL